MKHFEGDRKLNNSNKRALELIKIHCVFNAALLKDGEAQASCIQLVTFHIPRRATRDSLIYATCICPLNIINPKRHAKMPI